MNVTAKQVLEGVSYTLQDADFTQWTVPELWSYLLDALRTVSQLRPDLLTVRTSFSLRPGAQQIIPDGYNKVRRVLCNSEAGSYRSPVRTTDFYQLSFFAPDFAGAPSSSRVREVAFDPEQLDRFWVYPPNDGTGEVTADLSYDFSRLTPSGSGHALGDYDFELPGVSESVVPALRYYVLHRAWAKDSDSAGDEARSKRDAEYFSAYLGAAPVKGQGKEGNT